MQERAVSQPGRVLLISIMAAVLLVGAVVCAGGAITIRAVPRRQNALSDLTDTADAQIADAADTADAQTSDAGATADAQTAVIEDTVAAQTDAAQQTSPTPTNTATQTSTSATGVPTPTASPQVFRSPVLPTLPPVLSPPPIATRIDLVPTLVDNTPPNSERMPPTRTPPPGAMLICPVGQPIALNGSGPAHTAFLLYFDTRVVGGGSVTANGAFTAHLVVGNERAGEYAVTVHVRGTTQILLQLTCSVPVVTPTAQPVRTASR